MTASATPTMRAFFFILLLSRLCFLPLFTNYSVIFNSQAI